MRSRAFFFTVTTIIGITIIVGMIMLVRSIRSHNVHQPIQQTQDHIRMDQTVQGSVTDIMQNTGSITVLDSSGQEMHLAIIPETRVTNTQGESIDLSHVYTGATVEGKGEQAAADAMIVAELRVISDPDIVILTPTTIGPVASPLEIKGLAKGNWFFEANFPVTITDADHNQLGQHYVTATADWMSESLVPFTGTLEFSPPKTATGYLVFKNDNPSGASEHEKTFELPITFTPQTRTVQLFFNNKKLDPAYLCSTVFPVSRKIPWTEGIARATIEELIKGPSEEEKVSAYFTNIAPDVRVNALTIENGVAKIDLSEELERNVAGSCRVSAIRSQITQTLKQFPTINSVIVSINGNTDTILQP